MDAIIRKFGKKQFEILKTGNIFVVPLSVFVPVAHFVLVKLRQDH
jgi:H+/gluconate symporter-like permease